ncbi:MAG: hypothetical protein ACR2FY_15100 [Pirellulaceae bacterium]
MSFEKWKPGQKNFWLNRREGLQSCWDAAKYFAALTGREDFDNLHQIRSELGSLIKKAWLKVSEVELCAKFIEFVKKSPAAWTVYNETGSFDLLLVGSDGIQFGIQGKKRFGAKVIRQALANSIHGTAPDFRGILLPGMNRDVFIVCSHLNLVPIFPTDKTMTDFFPNLSQLANWPRWETSKRIELPAYVADGRAGSPMPNKLTEWKIKSLKLIAILEIRGYLTENDFQALRFRPSLWVENGWLWQDGGTYIRGSKLTLDKKHPQVFSQILSEVKKSLPKENKKNRGKHICDCGREDCDECQFLKFLVSLGTKKPAERERGA